MSVGAGGVGTIVGTASVESDEIVRIHSLFVMADDGGADVALVESDGDLIGGTYYCGSYGGVVLPYNPGGWFEASTSGEGIYGTSLGGVKVTIEGNYSIIGE